MLQHQASNKSDEVEGSSFLKNQLIAGTDMKLINFTAYRELENGVDSVSGFFDLKNWNVHILNKLIYIYLLYL